MPQYQGVWNLQDAARLQSQQQWVTDPLFENTTLLLQADNAAGGAQNNTFLDSSANAFTITRNGNTTQGTFTPFSATGWSNYFSGADIYPPAGSSFSFTGDFTVEFFINLQTTSTTAPSYIIMLLPSTTYFAVNAVAGTGFDIFLNSGSASMAVRDLIPALGKWHHVALVRSGSTVKLYMDGVASSTTATNSSTLGSSTVPFYVCNGSCPAVYMSNVRVVKGSAVYTANFNPPTSPLTAITNTVLLTCQDNRFKDNSTNNFSFTIDNTPSVQAFAPFAPQFQYTPTVIGGSGFFDGTGDYLTVPDNSAFDIGSGNFSIECWVYPTASASTTYLVSQVLGSTAAGSYVLWVDGSGYPTFYSTTGGTTSTRNDITSGTLLALRSWTHLCICRSGSTLSLYQNGTRVATQTYSSTIFDSTNNIGIGGDPTGSVLFTGYISNVRLVKGSSAYDATQTTITIPTAPPTAITNTSLLTNFTNAAITDGTMKNNLETVGNAQVSTSIVKYGSGSMYFDGTGDNCLLPYSPGLHLSGDFTIECWIYPLAYGGMILNMGGGSGIAWASYELVNQTDGVNFAASSANSGYDIGSETGSTGRIGTIPLNAWSHLAVTRSGNVYRGFVNGVQGYTQTLALTPYNTLTRGLAIGSNYTTTWGTGTPTNTINGYLDDLRITNGAARYTANFTPPQVALPRQ